VRFDKGVACRVWARHGGKQLCAVELLLAEVVELTEACGMRVEQRGDAVALQVERLVEEQRRFGHGCGGGGVGGGG
jgi:hypothetical protein